jgi:hypothetical protein
MKKVVKDKVFIPILSIFVIVAILISIASSIRYKNNQKLLIEDYYQSVEKCKNLTEEASEEEVEWCKNLIEMGTKQFDTNAYDAYDTFASDYLTMYFNDFLLIAIIVVGSSYYVTKYLRNRVILNDITRESYKSIIKKLFLSAWKYALMIPLFLFIIYFIIFLTTEHFCFREGLTALYDYTGTIGTIFENNLILLFLAIIIKSIILSMIYINITLIVSRKEHNYFLSIIISYIFIFGIELFFEIFFSNFLDKTNLSDYDLLFNILNIYTYPFTEYDFLQIFILLGILLLSFIPLFLVYKNKEKLIIDSEKNDNSDGN